MCANDSPDPPVGREIGVSHIIPVNQTFPWLIQAGTFDTHNVMLGIWNKGVMEAYLRTCSIATTVRTNIWNLCRPKRTTNIINEEETNVVDDNEVDDSYAHIATVGESKFVPALWNSPLLMNAYLDCGMHLVFHGILAYCVEKNGWIFGRPRIDSEI